jgi:hypothetical protein
MGLWKANKDVTIQDSTQPLFQYFLLNEQKKDILLTSDISIDDEVINVSSGHGFTAVAGEHIVIWGDSVFEQAKVKSVSTDAITVDIPMASPFTIADAKITRGNYLLNVDGSVTPVDFKFTMDTAAIVPIDLSKVVITMQHGANVPDDGKFGGLAELTNGMYFRHVNGTRINLGNYINNQDFKDRGAVVAYTDKAPAGTNATNIVFDIKEIFGQVMRINPRAGDYVLAKIRDNISSGAGMAKMIVSVIGSYTEGE